MATFKKRPLEEEWFYHEADDCMCQRLATGRAYMRVPDFVAKFEPADEEAAAIFEKLKKLGYLT